MVAWKFLLASAALASDQCEDQTALLQSHLASHKSALGSSQAESLLNFPKMATLNDPTKRKMALAQFEETAMELAKNKAGITDTVVEVCEETAELLESTVLAAIVNEHDVDQAMLNSAYAAFAPIEETRAGMAEIISSATGNVQGRIQEHTMCRTDENAQCVTAGHCEEECERLTELEELTKVELEVIDHEVHDHFCHGDEYITTSTMEQHETNRAEFQAYIDKLAELTALQAEMNLQCSLCQASETNHTESRTVCNTMQQELEAAACNDLHVGAGDLEVYLTSFHAARGRYESTRASVMIMEADRKVEWDTLTRVICLLMTLTNPDDGAASSDETAAAIAACQPLDADTGIGSHVDTSHLDIEYHTLPDPLGLPDLPVNPCTDEFIQMAYVGTPTCAPYDTEYDHGIVIECTCFAEAYVIQPYGFPHELGPFLLFDTGFSFDAEGFQLINNGQDWSVHVDADSSYTGRLSMFAAITLPDLDAAFGVSVAQVAWAYPDPQGTAEMIALHGEDYTETMQQRFLRTGGYVYLNAEGVPVALKEISPSATNSLGQNPELTLYFGDGRPITEAQALAACPRGYNQLTLSSIIEAGGEAYCWNFDATIDFCGHGCFLYRTTSGYVGFPVTDAPDSWLIDNLDGATYIPATDQYGATPVAMITGQAPQEAPANIVRSWDNDPSEVGAEAPLDEVSVGLADPVE